MLDEFKFKVNKIYTDKDTVYTVVRKDKRSYTVTHIDEYGKEINSTYLNRTVKEYVQRNDWVICE